jgi:hypothetical protein
LVARITSSTPPARQEIADLQVVRPDAVQRRQRPHQHVIDAVEVARLLDPGHVLRLLDDADKATIAGRVGTEVARVGVGDVAAHRAVGDAVLDVAHRLDEPLDLLARRLQDVEGEPGGALRADAGQALQLLDQPGQRLGAGHGTARVID